MATKDALQKLRPRVSLIAKRDPDELSAVKKSDDEISEARIAWNVSCIGTDMRQHLKVPVGMEFGYSELYLAGWVNVYADQQKIAFSTALERIFEFLTRHPDVLKLISGNDEKNFADFAEFVESASGSVVPQGWTYDPQDMETFKRARVYQAANPTTDLVQAVIEVNKGDQEIRARIATLQTENARMKADLAQRKAAASR